ncbi:TPA: hypothetical protein OMT42_000497 [Klebsiella aerogenes]|nr:hypothetical protein [Klebsiella aerogenes]
MFNRNFLVLLCRSGILKSLPLKKHNQMLSLEEIAQLTYNTLQSYMDQRGIDLAVGPLSDIDANSLSRAYGDLNWEWYLTEIGNRDDCFSLCIKLVTSQENKLVEHYPAGVALCTYFIDTKIFEVHAVENFVKDTEDHPLRRKMVLYTLYAALIFMNQVDGEAIKIIEPVEDKIDYYRTFGFEMQDGNQDVMHCSFEKLQTVLATLAS